MAPRSSTPRPAAARARRTITRLDRYVRASYLWKTILTYIRARNIDFSNTWRFWSRLPGYLAMWIPRRLYADFPKNTDMEIYLYKYNKHY
jgi:hypothetical protein